MEDVVLIVGTSLIFLFGWFLMKRLDQFLVENQKRIEEETEQQPEPYVWLNGDISPDELDEALSRFRSSHTNVKIAIYDPDEFPFLDNKSDLTQ
nr:class I SAM-dependent methyltransferase [uncultured Agathobaculum sp.]